jgi:hypothetical protein
MNTKKSIVLRKKEYVDTIFISTAEYEEYVKLDDEFKEKSYIDILKNLEDKYKKYAVIKPTDVFVEIYKQTNALFMCGFNVVFECISKDDDYKISYISKRTKDICVWYVPLKFLKKQADMKKLNDYNVYYNDENDEEIYKKGKTNILSKKDINMIDIIHSLIYFNDVPKNTEYFHKCCVISCNSRIPTDFPQYKNIKCAFIGDYIFDKIKGYENAETNMVITSKIFVGKKYI